MTDYLYSRYNGCPTIGNLYFLLHSNNSNVIKQVGIYVKKLLDLVNAVNVYMYACIRGLRPYH